MGDVNLWGEDFEAVKTGNIGHIQDCDHHPT